VLLSGSQKDFAGAKDLVRGYIVNSVVADHFYDISVDKSFRVTPENGVDVVDRSVVDLAE